MKTYRVVIERNGHMDTAYVEADKIETDAKGVRLYLGKELVGSFRRHVVQGWSVVAGEKG